MKKFNFLVVLLAIGCFFGIGSTVRAAEKATYFDVSLKQILEKESGANGMTGVYQLSLVQGELPSEVKMPMNVAISASDTQKMVLTFGQKDEGKVIPLLPTTRYSFELSLLSAKGEILQQTAPIYRIEIQTERVVAGKVPIHWAFIRDMGSDKKVDEIEYTFKLKGHVAPPSTSDSSSSSNSSTTDTTMTSTTTSTTISTTISSTTTSTSDKAVVPPRLPNTGNPISRVTNKVLKILKLPQTGTQQATYIGLIGLVLILAVVIRVFFIVKKRQNEKETE